MSTAIRIRNLTKRFGDFVAVDNVSLDIAPGQFVTLLGGSGCGKTTILRMIAGFLEADGGEIHFGDQLMNGVLPEKRDTSMMFQSYALFPHKTVENNVNFGLRMRGVDKAAQRAKVEEMLQLVHMQKLNGRKPQELSGGQQQRVALARAMAVTPKVLLFDEPLSNLDAKLRVEVRMEIREIQRRCGITTVYVTHDQEEALSISDKVVVMDRGQIVQAGAPEEIYKRPANSFVANFIGTSNVFEILQLEEAGGRMMARTNIGLLETVMENGDERRLLSVRPEDILVSGKPCESRNTLRGVVASVAFLGRFKELVVDVPGAKITAEADKYLKIEEGDPVCLMLPADKLTPITR